MRFKSSLLAAAVCAVAFGAHAARAQTTGTLRVVHGLPGRDVAATLDPALPVDVLVNGSICLLKGLTFGSVSGPFTLPTGTTFHIQVSLANTLKPCGNSTVVDKFTFLSPDDENVLVVGEQLPSGTPFIFDEHLDFSAVPVGKTRLTVVHAADAPNVDIGVNGAVGIANQIPGTVRTALVAGGVTDQITVAPAGSGKPVIGPTGLSLPVRADVLIFAVGSTKTGSIGLITSTIKNDF